MKRLFRVSEYEVHDGAFTAPGHGRFTPLRELPFDRAECAVLWLLRHMALGRLAKQAGADHHVTSICESLLGVHRGRAVAGRLGGLVSLLFSAPRSSVEFLQPPCGCASGFETAVLSLIAACRLHNGAALAQALQSLAAQDVMSGETTRPAIEFAVRIAQDIDFAIAPAMEDAPELLTLHSAPLTPARPLRPR